MSSSRFLSFSLTLCLFVSISQHSAKSQDANNNNNNNNSGDGSGTVQPSPSACTNCTICQYPCHPQPPPPSGDGSYAVPPPPATQSNCPPATPVQCCTGQNSAPPSPFYYPYNNGSYPGAAPDQGKMLCLHVALCYSLLFYYFI